MLIVIEGVDSSGKATQAERLYDYLAAKQPLVKKVTFPDYNSPSSALVKMYLAGEFGDKPGDVSPYAASTFYAVDRFASHATNWGETLRADGIVICDRYVTSNMVHQAAKLATHAEQDAFLDWVYDLEYCRLGLPTPDLVLFLDMPPAVSLQLMAERNNKITGTAEKDIHERDGKYIETAYATAKYVAAKYGWNTVSCTADGRLRTIDEIHADIITITEGALHGFSTNHSCG